MIEPARDYDGFKSDLDRSLQVLRTDHLELYQLHDLRPHELGNLRTIESGAVRAAREAKDQKVIRAFGVTGHSAAGILTECMKRFDPDCVLTIFPSTRPDKGRYEDELLPLARERRPVSRLISGRASNAPKSPMLRRRQGVELKMSRRLRCSSVTYRFRYAPSYRRSGSDRLAGGSF
jgi:aryl-alcohol dehydrogenase-like predicted oxidoreductase